MGRDLFVKNGVSVSLILNFENIKIINKLRQSQKFNCYVTDHIENEAIDINYGDDYRLNIKEDNLYLLESCKNSEEFEIVYRKFENKKITYNFLYVCCEAFAPNFNEKNNLSVFGSENSNPEDIAERFMEGKILFLEAGIQEEFIKIGYQFYSN